ncbi:hypothetical protein ACLOJK_010092 [Asimina triloba]
MGFGIEIDERLSGEVKGKMILEAAELLKFPVSCASAWASVGILNSGESLAIATINPLCLGVRLDDVETIVVNFLGIRRMQRW